MTTVNCRLFYNFTMLQCSFTFGLFFHIPLLFCVASNCGNVVCDLARFFFRFSAYKYNIAPSSSSSIHVKYTNVNAKGIYKKPMMCVLFLIFVFLFGCDDNKRDIMKTHSRSSISARFHKKKRPGRKKVNKRWESVQKARGGPKRTIFHSVKKTYKNRL